jgi:hypothetical protein
MDIGQLKSLAKQKAGAKKIAKALNRTPGATTVKAHMKANRFFGTQPVRLTRRAAFRSTFDGQS